MKKQSPQNLKYSFSFSRALDFVLAAEGGYSNQAADRGGETKFGISQRAHPDVDIAKLNIDQAIAMYHENYWLPGKCDELPPWLAALLFDALVHHHPGTAKRMMQRALGVKRDAIIGPKTIAAAQSAEFESTTSSMLAARASLFAQIYQSDRLQLIFLHGWYKRLFALHSFVAGMKLTIDDMDVTHG